MVALVDVEVKFTANGAAPLSGLAEKLATGGSLFGPVPPESSPVVLAQAMIHQ